MSPLRYTSGRYGAGMPSHLPEADTQGRPFRLLKRLTSSGGIKMIDAIQRFFNAMKAGGAEAEEAATSLELATAALLFEVARADYRLDDSEMALLRELLQRRFGLAEADLDELMRLAREEAETAVDHYRFVSLVKEHFDYDQRCELVRMMWSLSLADGEQHHLEEHRIRRLAELLHVSHSDFIHAKLKVQQAADD